MFVRPSLRLVLVCQDDFRMTSVFVSQVILSKVSVRAVSGLSVLTSYERRSLKYFVLFFWRNV